MSQEQFEHIDQQFEGVNLRLDGMDTRFEQIDRRFEAVDRRLEQMDRRFDGIDVRLDELGVQMRVLHEDTRQILRTLDEGYRDLPRQMAVAIADVMAKADARISPVEDAERLHSRILDEHEVRITSLERGPLNRRS